MMPILILILILYLILPLIGPSLQQIHPCHPHSIIPSAPKKTFHLGKIGNRVQYPHNRCATSISKSVFSVHVTPLLFQLHFLFVFLHVFHIFCLFLCMCRYLLFVTSIVVLFVWRKICPRSGLWRKNDIYLV